MSELSTVPSAKWRTPCSSTPRLTEPSARYAVDASALRIVSAACLYFAQELVHAHRPPGGNPNTLQVYTTFCDPLVHVATASTFVSINGSTAVIRRTIIACDEDSVASRQAAVKKVADIKTPRPPVIFIDPSEPRPPLRMVKRWIPLRGPSAKSAIHFSYCQIPFNCVQRQDAHSALLMSQSQIE